MKPRCGECGHPAHQDFCCYALGNGIATEVCACQPQPSSTEEERPALRIKLTDGSSWPNPNDGGLARRLVFGGEASRGDILLAASYIDAYKHIALHVAGTESILAQVRMLRRAVKPCTTTCDWHGERCVEVGQHAVHKCDYKKWEHKG